MENRPSWSSQFAFILSAVGSAVGLGNIWRFPYVMGKNGGAVFLIVYLTLIISVCVVPLLAEMILGKVTQKDTIGAFSVINSKFRLFGRLNVITAILVSSFYFVVGGWIIYYIFNSFSLVNISDFGQYFDNLVVSPLFAVLFSVIFLLICCFFVYRGVNRGIELANKIMMPIFGILLIALMFVSLNLPNADLGLKFMFSPDFSKLSFSMILAALGQALFTLSIGMGAILTYGSYLKKEDSVLKSAYSIIFADTVFALLAGIMIFPAVFSFGLEPDSGAGLVFITLPKIFTQMQYGGFVALGFFSLLFFAALTSGISIIEVIVASFIGSFNISRAKASVLTAFIIGALIVPVALSFGVLNNVRIFGMNIFDSFDFITSNLFMPLNSLLVCFVVGWFVKLANDTVFKSEILHKLLMFMMKFVLPVLLLSLIVIGLKG